MRDVLAHRMDDGTETFSILATMTYKTEEHAISSILIHEITTRAGTAVSADALGNIICSILSEQWNRCLKEEVVHPCLICKLILVCATGIHSSYTEFASIAMLLDMQALPNFHSLTNPSSSNNSRTPRIKTNLQQRNSSTTLRRSHLLTRLIIHNRMRSSSSN